MYLIRHLNTVIYKNKKNISVRDSLAISFGID